MFCLQQAVDSEIKAEVIPSVVIKVLTCLIKLSKPLHKLCNINIVLQIGIQE